MVNAAAFCFSTTEPCEGEGSTQDATSAISGRMSVDPPKAKQAAIICWAMRDRSSDPYRFSASRKTALDT